MSLNVLVPDEQGNLRVCEVGDLIRELDDLEADDATTEDAVVACCFDSGPLSAALVRRVSDLNATGDMTAYEASR